MKHDCAFLARALLVLAEARLSRWRRELRRYFGR
jgi:hypothetical protein